MGKKSKRNSGPRSGSDRAEKLARRAAERENAESAVNRPFAGIAAECDLVAMREFVPSATATLPLRDNARSITVATVLPGAVAALTRDVDGTPEGFVAVQVQAYSDDLGADLAGSIAWAQNAEPAESLSAANPGDDTPALADLIDPDAQLDITVHQSFNWWIPEGIEPAPEVAATVQHANETIMPSARVNADGVVAAWWVDAGEKAHIRWVRPEDEDQLMLALARVHATGDLHLGEGSRFAGSFRTQGLLVPVFDLDREKHPDEWAPGLVALAARLDEALAVDAPLTTAERRARDGLRGRQVTLIR
ncbi:MAG: hypothetical protein GX542_04610 [Rhodococcus sp.]|nr:hypothetical protein [Rhodococcus sp. (in: high G+C Gram-positive bacteria)]